MEFTYDNHTYELENTSCIETLAQNIAQALKQNHALPRMWESVSLESDDSAREITQLANRCIRQLRQEGGFTQEQYITELKGHIAHYCIDKWGYERATWECAQEISLALEEQLGSDQIAQSLCDALESRFNELDDSCVLDCINCKTELFYTPDIDLHDGGYEDGEYRITRNRYGGFDDLSGLPILLKLANVSTEELVAYIHKNEPNCDFVSTLEKINIERDMSLPHSMSTSYLFTVLDNAWDGYAAFTTYVDVKALVTRDVFMPMILNKGAIGIEDIVCGSGHAESIRSPIVIPAHDDNWTALPASMERDSVYGYSIGQMTSQL